MRLYLLRHAEASYDAPNDSQRELTPKGERSIEKLCGHLKAKEFSQLESIHHSTLVRAKQTAQLFRSGLGLEQPLIEREGLAPEDNPMLLGEWLREANSDLMFVGHNPHLSILAAWLITGDPNADCIDFKKTGLLCLERGSTFATRRSAGVWIINWYSISRPFS
ncbi:MAG: phosphohistidine phosphatase SixA [Verrucomicrobiota bacterium]